MGERSTVRSRWGGSAHGGTRVMRHVEHPVPAIPGCSFGINRFDRMLGNVLARHVHAAELTKA